MKIANIFIAIVALIVIIVGALAYYLFFAAPPAANPSQLKPYASPVQRSYVAQNTAIYDALSSAGLADALVDVTDSRVLVRVPLRSGMSMKSTAYYVFGASYKVSPQSPTVIVEFLENGTLSGKWSVATSDIAAYINGTLNDATFAQKVTVSYTH